MDEICICSRGVELNVPESCGLTWSDTAICSGYDLHCLHLLFRRVLGGVLWRAIYGVLTGLIMIPTHRHGICMCDYLQ